MVLSSQNIRSSRGVRGKSYRKKRRPIPWFTLIFLVALVGFVYVFFFMGKEKPTQPTEANKTPSNSNDDTPVIAPGHDGSTQNGVDGNNGGAPENNNQGNQNNNNNQRDPDPGNNGNNNNENTPPDPGVMPNLKFVVLSKINYKVPSDAVTADWARQQIVDAYALVNTMKAENWIEARARLTRLLEEEGKSISPGDALNIRNTLMQLNEKLIFSPRVYPGDPLTETYTIQFGDSLSRIAMRYSTTDSFLQLINDLPNKHNIVAGKKMKVFKGPINCEITLDGYLADFYASTDQGAVYICTLPVGIGDNEQTPPGLWVVKNKTENPAWTDPRDRKHYDRDDPANPIGEFWIGLRGTDENTREIEDIGIHGTIDPASIGKAQSRGCIRLRPRDIAMTFSLLTEQSVVLIRNRP